MPNKINTIPINTPSAYNLDNASKIDPRLPDEIIVFPFCWINIDGDINNPHWHKGLFIQVNENINADKESIFYVIHIPTGTLLKTDRKCIAFQNKKP